MIEKGFIVKTIDDKAVVRLPRKAECDTCHKCLPSSDGKHVEIVVDNSLCANVGDCVKVETGKTSLHFASAIVYAIPLVFVGILVGVGSILTPLAQLIMGVSGFAVGLVPAILIDRLLIRKRKGFKAYTMEICPPPDDDAQIDSADKI